VMGERLIVGKETHVVEEVHIYKHQVTEQQQVSGMLRKEHLRVDGDVQLEDDARDERLQGDSAHQDRSSWS
jgi:stress response protein YsnF